MITSLIEEFQYPRLGPGHDVGDAAAELVEAARLRGRTSHRPSPAIRARRRRAPWWSTTTPTARPPRHPCDAGRSRRCRSADAGAGDGPAGARRRPGGRGRAALPRLPHRRPGRARRARVPRQLDLRARSPEVQRRADPELRVLVAVHGQGRPHLPRAGVLRQRGRRALGRMPDDELVALGTARARGARAGADAAWSRPGYVVRMPKAYPVYDEDYAAQRRRAARLAGGARAERAAGRPQRHAPLQQPGPLDAHRDAGGGEHRRDAAHDVWAVNVEEEYHEEGRGTGRDAPVVPAGRAAVPG